LRKKNTKNNSKKRVIDATKNLLPDNNNGAAYRNRLKPKTENQREYIRTVAENTITFSQGPAGSGKTHIAVGMALEYLLENKVKKIIITRPVFEAGEKLGYLPGTAEEKLHPYLLPILDEVHHFISFSHYSSLKSANKIEIAPLGLMRGRNFHDCFIVADECQNASYDQLKMLLTRIGNNSKMILTGDGGQSDLPRSQRGGFVHMMNGLEGIEGIGNVQLIGSDIVRNPIIIKMLGRLEQLENEDNKY
jgi:phosphate starvation-inducible PhoH-like protein